MPYTSPAKLLEFPEHYTRANQGKFILRGLPTRCLRAFQLVTAATNEELLHILWMSSRTIKSRLHTCRLTPVESDRLYCAARIIANALLQFEGDEEKVRSWLRSPASKDHPVLPINLLGTFGGAELADYYLRDTYFETYLLTESSSLKASEKEEEKYSDPLSILGLKRSWDIDDRIRRGFPYRSYELFRKRTLFSAKEMEDILWTSSATLSRYHARGRLSGEISDRLYRAAVVFYFVNSMIGDDPKDAQEWIHDEIPNLGYRRPIDLLKTDPESHEVIATACRIMDGMVA